MLVSARRGNAASLAARLLASSRHLPTDTTFITKPAASASCAPIGSPVKIISFALATPIRRCSRCVPPPPGNAPILISGRPKARGLRSDAKIGGYRQFAAAAQGQILKLPRSPVEGMIPPDRRGSESRAHGDTSDSASAGPPISLISAPAQKISSLPVMTTARMAALRARSFSKLAISWPHLGIERIFLFRPMQSDRGDRAVLSVL